MGDQLTPAKWYQIANPCDIDRHPALAPIGDAFYRLWRGFAYGTECQCCLGARLVAITVVSFGAGAWLL